MSIMQSYPSFIIVFDDIIIMINYGNIMLKKCNA